MAVVVLYYATLVVLFIVGQGEGVAVCHSSCRVMLPVASAFVLCASRSYLPRHVLVQACRIPCKLV
jgi:hypothetical protein